MVDNGTGMMSIYPFWMDIYFGTKYKKTMDSFNRASKMIIELQNKNAKLELDNAALNSMLKKVEGENKKLQKDLIELSSEFKIRTEENENLKKDYNTLFNQIYTEK